MNFEWENMNSCQYHGIEEKEGKNKQSSKLRFDKQGQDDWKTDVSPQFFLGIY